MRLGIISDVHGNLEAFEAVLEVLRERGAARLVCCGDIVGYGPDPNACIDAIRDVGCVGVAGNHDWAAAGIITMRNFNSAAERAVLWTRPLLTEGNRRYLESLPLTLEDGPLFIVHSAASAPKAWKYVLTAREAAVEMTHYLVAVCVVGHSHQPFVVERVNGGPARQMYDESFEIRPDAKYFINAGSVGQPRDGDPRACCMLYDGDRRTMTYLRIPYDIPAVQRKIRASGLPEYLASRLAAGQ